jgi:hypothetical protein
MEYNENTQVKAWVPPERMELAVNIADRHKIPTTKLFTLAIEHALGCHEFLRWLSYWGKYRQTRGPDDAGTEQGLTLGDMVDD